MILSHRHRFLFLKTTKTAGTSLEMALAKYCGPDDVITVIHRDDEATKAALGLPGPRNHLLPDTAYRPSDVVRALRDRAPVERFYNHSPAASVRAKVPADVWSGALKFAIVRDPFDYVVSRYFWANRQGEHSPKRFRKWLLSEPKRLRVNRTITDIDGRPAVDAMLRYETLAADVAALAARLGLPDTLPAEFAALGAKSGIRPKTATPREMFDGFDEGVAFVQAAFADDIREFGYGPP
jgi:hypothetical protein